MPFVFRAYPVDLRFTDTLSRSRSNKYIYSQVADMNRRQKEDSRRRKVLEALRSESPIDSRPAEQVWNAPVVVGEFYNKKVCRRFRTELSEMGIQSHVQSRGRRILVFVDRVSSSAAKTQFESFKTRTPDTRPLAPDRECDFTLLGVIVGAIGSISIVQAIDDLRGRLIAVIGVMGIAVWCGAIADRGRQDGQQTSFSMFHALLFFTLLALSWGLVVALTPR